MQKEFTLGLDVAEQESGSQSKDIKVTHQERPAEHPVLNPQKFRLQEPHSPGNLALVMAMKIVAKAKKSVLFMVNVVRVVSASLSFVSNYGGSVIV